MQKDIKAEIITIGDEILYGQITDTNSQWISNELDKVGIQTIRKSSVGDQKNEIIKILEEAESRADILIITGGLGPTSDDITKPALAAYFNCTLELNHEALKQVEHFFQLRNKELTDINKTQAYLPSLCKAIHNTKGTAPGMWFEKNGKIFVSLPGVPYEMKSLMSDEVIPALLKYFNPSKTIHHIIRTIGIGESFLSEIIQDWEQALPSPLKLAYLPSLNGVKLRITGIANGSISHLKTAIEEEVRKLKKLIPQYMYAEEDISIEAYVSKILSEQKLSIASAESCTGGYFAHLLTSIPGSSAYYKGSIIAYSNEIKEKILSVKKEILLQYGAVSEQTVKEMAENVRQLMSTDIGIATSGIAGPEGGTPEKPVGTIWIAYSDKNQTITKKLSLGNVRDVNIKMTAYAVFNLIRQSLSVFNGDKA